MATARKWISEKLTAWGETGMKQRDTQEERGWAPVFVNKTFPQAPVFPRAFYSPALFSHNFPRCGRRPLCLNPHNLGGVSWPLTFLHNPESHLPDGAIDIWPVCHLAGEGPVVAGLQVPDDDGNIVPLNVPIPGHSVFKPSHGGLVGLLQVVKYLQKSQKHRMAWDGRDLGDSCQVQDVT